MNIELKCAVGQLFTFRLSAPLDSVEYREIDLSSRMPEAYRTKILSDTERGTMEFSIMTVKPASTAIIELKAGLETLLFSARNAIEKKYRDTSISIEAKLFGRTLRFKIEPHIEIDGSHLMLCHCDQSMCFIGDISAGTYVLGRTYTHDEVRHMLMPDRYLNSVLSRIFC